MVHTFEALGVKLAVDVNSGAVHVLDDLTYRLLPLVEPPMAEHCPPELLDRLPEYRTEAVEEGWQDLRELAGNGLLFVEDDYVDPAAATALQRFRPHQGPLPPRLPRLQPALPVLFCVHRRLRYRSEDHGH